VFVKPKSAGETAVGVAVVATLHCHSHNLKWAWARKQRGRQPDDRGSEPRGLCETVASPAQLRVMLGGGERQTPMVRILPRLHPGRFNKYFQYVESDVSVPATRET
jgi:hypothetical protein